MPRRVFSARVLQDHSKNRVFVFEIHLFQNNFDKDKKRETMDMIRAEGLSKTYRTGEVAVPALKNLDFSIEKGAFVSFVGPSGSGKTTLLNLIGCLDRPTAGRLRVADKDVSAFKSKEAALFRGEHIGFIFQSFNLIPVLTAFENVEYPLIMVRSVPATDRKKRVEELLEAVGMSARQHQMPDQLSGGQKQRVAIARALVTRPVLVLADEPTANLDHETAYGIIRLMKEIQKKFLTTFVFSTHDTRIIDAAEQIYRIEDGVLKDENMKGGGHVESH